MNNRDDLPAMSTSTTSSTGPDDLTQGNAPSDPELTAHEYAIECGLCTQYLMESPLDILQCMDGYETLGNEIEGLEGAAQQEVTIDELARERLNVDSEARELLYRIMKDEEDLFLHSLPMIKSFSSNLKLEPPLLETDHEFDVLHFGHRPTPDFVNMNLPMEGSVREKDESMEWPTKYMDLPQRMERKYSAEKLDFPREGLEFLMDVMKDSWDAMDMKELYANEFAYTRVRSMGLHSQR